MAQSGFIIDRLGWRDRTGQQRFLFHMIAWLVIWPLTSAASGIVWITEQSLSGGAPLAAIAAGAFLSAFRMAPEFYLVAVIGLAFTFIAFSLLELTRATPRSRWLFLLEPLSATFAFFAGVSLVYPSILRHPLLVPFHPLRVGQVTIGVGLSSLALLAILGWLTGRGKGATAAVVLALLVASLGYTLSSVRPGIRQRAGAGNIVLLGLDSTGISDHLTTLETYVKGHGGTWYTRGVSPGLLTNSVWTAVLRDQPVPETGVFLVFQSADWGSRPDIVQRARQRGFRTVSWITGQFSIFVGSEAGFDEDRSGAKGWLDVGTSGVKDSSILLPVLLPHLPRIPWAITPRNQNGTFAYDLDADLRDILTVKRDRPVFVAAHISYLHSAVYPSYRQLRPDQRRAIWNSPVEVITDQSLNWQFPEVKGDPIGLHRWKIQNIQRAVAQAFDTTGFLDPANGNRIVLFSDHGDRTGITPFNFGNPKYFNVLFATFGVPSRMPDAPVSLLDTASLVGLAPPERHRTVVAYTNAYSAREMAKLKQTAGLSIDGSVELNQAIVDEIGKRLTCFDPTDPRGYWPCRPGTKIP